VPNIFHGGARLGIIPAEHFPAMPAEERRDPVVRGAIDVHRNILEFGHYSAELLEILFARVLKIDRYVRVGQPESEDARRFVRQSFLVGMQGKVYDVLDAERLDIGELPLGRLAGGGDSVVEATPVLHRVWIGHLRCPISAF
jgi:hypothetical protein